ncbi:hypothetical protein [Methanosarcina horonobensis]|uniref:hypothetical protein n=1 Tax=Methanosarcina horonobensis TaxID=418008 RepID=UPI000A4D5397|nr:hypothetical protein [Methanosarcina horonobensis]
MVDKLAADNNNIPVEYIFQIHESPCRAVLAITGGGAEIIGELLRHGNGSATVLDAVVPYSTDALDRFLGRKPEKYCSEKTARLMAMVAYQRALDLSKGSGSADREVIGIGATCKLKAANEREGRKHEIHVSIQTACETGMSTLELAAERTREEEEKIAEFLIFNVLARHSNVPEIDLFDRIDTGDGLEEKVIEKYEFVSGSVGDLLKQKMCNQDSLYETLDMIRISLKEAKDPENKGNQKKTESPERSGLYFPALLIPAIETMFLWQNWLLKNLVSPYTLKSL